MMIASNRLFHANAERVSFSRRETRGCAGPALRYQPISGLAKVLANARDANRANRPNENRRKANPTAFKNRSTMSTNNARQTIARCCQCRKRP
jgi:hypothetical protein